ncbi:LysM peptidoglycan-binding domain-containing protein [Candidatus Merdisoma sp. JLR.KK011]|uniref:LysM peptidoglycan-binding domain-containing protein n=1 Tax=Candidatus Merdisoma sp. JLR.KK011 TaxID=3114299 RepID=UPI002FEFC5C5
MDNKKNNYCTEIWICSNESFPIHDEKIIGCKNTKKRKHTKIKFLLIPFITIFIVSTMFDDNRTYTYEEIVNYVVVEGDTLWDISRRYLGKGYKYIEIIVDNESEIDNPDLIYAGDRYQIIITHEEKVSNQ